MGARAICLCRDADVCRGVGNALAAAGIAVEHHATVPADPGEVALFVVDRRSRELAGSALRGVGAPVVIVGDDLADDAVTSLMMESPVSHLVRDPFERELTITSGKLASGDVFGLEKYLRAGVGVSQREVASELDKRVAIAEVTAWAEASGGRAPVAYRIANVVDELLMNAPVDAPRAASSARTAASLRYAHDDQVIAISVCDRHGALRQRDVIENVVRARAQRGRPLAAASGAGIGLYLVLANVGSLVINVERGRRTEVVALFDRPRRDRRAISDAARSFHVFQHQ